MLRLASAAAAVALAAIPAASGTVATGNRAFHPSDDDPAWSPDGRHIAFLRGDNLYVMERNGAKIHRMPGGGIFDWAPDGRLTFSRRDGNSVHLYSSHADGSGLRRLTFGAGRDYDPSWSPDGRYLLFERVSSDVTNIWRVSADGRNALRLTADGRSSLSYRRHAWSPDSRRFVYVSCAGQRCRRRRNDIFMMNASGSRRRRLTWRFANAEPSWSPDGRWIAYFSSRDGDVVDSSHSELSVVQTDGRRRRNVSRARSRRLQIPGSDAVTLWLPNGRIMFGAKPLGDLGGGSQFWVVGTDGLIARPLLRGKLQAQADDHGPDLTTNGRWIVFSRLHADPRFKGQLFGSIHLVRPDGTGLRRLTY